MYRFVVGIALRPRCALCCPRWAVLIRR
jgi:hypothetical protein